MRTGPYIGGMTEFYRTQRMESPASFFDMKLPPLREPTLPFGILSRPHARAERGASKLDGELGGVIFFI